MTTPADLRRLALALPETYEDLHRRRPAFRVNRKIFAMLGVSGNPDLFPGLGSDDIAVIKLDRDDQLNFVAALSGAVAETESYGHHGWTYLRLPDLAVSDLATLVRLAWSHVAPKRLVKSAAHA
jgi:hypothetical protein